MASILNADLSDLYDQWNQRVAFNEGYRAQQISEARQAGRDAFSLGVDRQQGREMYFDGRDQRMAEAREFLAAEPAAQIEAVEPDVVEPDQISDVMDGEETLGMESCVANETEDCRTWYDEAIEDHYKACWAEFNTVSAYDWADAHRMNREFDLN